MAPKSKVNVPDYSKYDKVEVTARGATHEEMVDSAKRQAAEYFGFNPEFADLEVAKFTATPHIKNAKGKVVEYRATFLVYIKPLKGAEGDEDGSSPGDLDSDEGNDGRRRPRGPEDFDWDE